MKASDWIDFNDISSPTHHTIKIIGFLNNK